MSEDSTQKWIGRNRPPRVQITYDLETGGADVKKELPLVVGILANLAGSNDTSLPKLKERKFIEIDRDNFNEVLKAIGPKLTVGTHALEFKKLDDFRPEAIVKTTSLKGLLEQRKNLSELLEKLETNSKFNDSLLANVVDNTDNRSKLKTMFPKGQIAKGNDPPPPPPPAEEENTGGDESTGKGGKKK